MLLVGNGTTVTRDENNPFLADGCVAIDHNLIVEVAETSELKRKYEGAHFVDAHGGIIMPGFINSHMHYYSAFARGFPGKGDAAPVADRKSVV